MENKDQKLTKSEAFAALGRAFAKGEKNPFEDIFKKTAIPESTPTQTDEKTNPFLKSLQSLKESVDTLNTTNINLAKSLEEKDGDSSRSMFGAAHTALSGKPSSSVNFSQYATGQQKREMAELKEDSIANRIKQHELKSAESTLLKQMEEADAKAKEAQEAFEDKEFVKLQNILLEKEQVIEDKQVDETLANAAVKQSTGILNQAKREEETAQRHAQSLAERLELESSSSTGMNPRLRKLQEQMERAEGKSLAASANVEQLTEDLHDKQSAAAQAKEAVAAAKAEHRSTKDLGEMAIKHGNSPEQDALNSRKTELEEALEKNAKSVDDNTKQQLLLQKEAAKREARSHSWLGRLQNRFTKDDGSFDIMGGLGKGGLAGIATSAVTALAGMVTDVVKTIADQQTKEEVGSAYGGMKQGQYANLIKTMNLGSDRGNALIQAASDSITTIQQSPDALGQMLERAITADVIGGGSGIDAGKLVNVAMKGDRTEMLKFWQDYMSNGGVSSAAAAFGMQDIVNVQNEISDDAEELRESSIGREAQNTVNLVEAAMSDVKMGDLEEATSGATQAVGEFADSLSAAVDTLSEISVSNTAQAVSEATDNEGVKVVAEAIKEGDNPLMALWEKSSFNTAPKKEVKSLTENKDIVDALEGKSRKKGNLELDLTPLRDKDIEELLSTPDNYDTGLVNMLSEAEKGQAHLLKAAANQSNTPQKVEVVAQVAVQGHMTTDDGRTINLQESGKEVKVTGAKHS